LGSYRYKPSIYISGGKDSYSSGGLISLSSNEEPSVELSGYNISGDVNIEVFEADELSVLDYLTHDKDGKQTKRINSVDRFKSIANVTGQVGGGYGRESKVILPLAEVGIYFLRITKDDVNEQAFVIRSPYGAVAKEGDNELIFWAQSMDNKRSLSSGQIEVYNLLDNARQISSLELNHQGIAKMPVSEDADIALVKADGKLALIPINLRYLNYGYSYKQFTPKSAQNKYFTFTDRPLYRPGDNVYFKTILRDDDDARYSIPTGLATVGFYSGWSEDDKISEKTYPIDEYGTVSGEFVIPQTAKTGDYHMKVTLPSNNSNSTYFQVEYFRKPEYSIDVTIPKTEFISKDDLTFTISGSYFSGQPLASQSVKYKVYSGDYYQYEYYRENYNYFLSENYRYGGWWGNDAAVTENTTTLNHLGKADVTLKLDNNTTKNRIYSIEAEFDNGSGNPSFVRKNVLVFAGEYDLFRQDYDSYYGTLSKPLTLPIKLVAHTNQSVDGISLNAEIELNNWVKEIMPEEKYPRYRKVTEKIPSLAVTTDKQGNATFSFQPTKTGSYSFTISGSDNRGNKISKQFYAYVRDKDYPYFSSDQNTNLNLELNKPEYSPKDTATLSIYSTIPNRDVLLTFERDRINRYQVISIEGNSVSVDVPLVETDMPNIYPTISSFSDGNLDEKGVNLKVSTLSKQLKVVVTPDKPSYGPSETVTLNVQTTDNSGNPQAADVAVWAVDKALFELVSENPKKISDVFWSERYANTSTAHSLEGITVNQAEMGGGCFTGETQIKLASGLTTDIALVKPDTQILTRKSEKNDKLVLSTVQSVHTATVSGILIVNQNLKVTPDHKLWLNKRWQPIGNAQIGDLLLDSQGKTITINSLEWQMGKTTVYNLELDGNHTFFANDIWVHNQKGGGGRTVFKDTAYWNPSVRTGTGGLATLRFKLPDNLTTWVISAVGNTQQTSVGQTKQELIVTKDVIIRPILPNIIRDKDDITLSALVQNFTNKDQTFDVSLLFDSGDVKQATQPGIVIKSQDSQEVSWQVKATRVNEKAKLRFAAIAQDNPQINDILTTEIPVIAFGYLETQGETGYDQTSFKISLAKDINSDKSSIKLSLAPSLLGTLPAAMDYLVYYPYGCVEQTTSRLLPILIAKRNPVLYSDALKDKKIDDMVQKGIRLLTDQQHFDGGWTWWGNGESDPFITTYVVENLLMARESGYEVDNQVFTMAGNFLARDDKLTTSQDMASKNYGLTLLNSDKRQTKPLNIEGLAPDLAALAVMSNYLNGTTDPSQSGLNQLIAMAKTQGDTLFWEAGDKNRFASRDASTAMVMRTILLAGGNREQAVKAARYLTAQHKFHYWSNTFSTVQVIRAITDLANSGQEANPDYIASVAIDNVVYKSGPIKSITQAPIEINIPLTKIKPTGSIITVTKEGPGQLYSTLVTKQFHTDPKAQANEHGMTITREYINEKGDEYSLALGDTAIVRLTVGGLQSGDYYGVIADELPAGLIPINESFKNQQYDNQRQNYYADGINNKEYTQNGIVMSLYQVATGTRTYEYKAQVVSAGTFIVPPATTSLMYAPEIYGRSDITTITVDKQSKIIASKKIQRMIDESKKLSNLDKLKLSIGLLVAIMLIIVSILMHPILKDKTKRDQLRHRLKNLFKKHDQQNPPLIPQNQPEQSEQK